MKSTLLRFSCTCHLPIIEMSMWIWSKQARLAECCGGCGKAGSNQPRSGRAPFPFPFPFHEHHHHYSLQAIMHTALSLVSRGGPDQILQYTTARAAAAFLDEGEEVGNRPRWSSRLLFASELEVEWRYTLHRSGAQMQRGSCAGALPRLCRVAD
jgi:hypothetical protein